MEMEQEQPALTEQNTITIEDIGPCKKKIIVEIPEETLKQAFDEQYSSLQRDAVVPGFRKGRAPRRLLEKRFGKETTDQVKLKLIAESSDAAVKDNKLDILGEPDVDFENIELPGEGSLKYEFEVEVWPEFQLPELEGIPVVREEVEVTDDQVEMELDQLRRISGVWTPRGQDDAVELDDQIIADITLDVEGVEEQEKLDNQEIRVRAHGFVGMISVENLDTLLIGAKAGQSRDTTVEVPSTYFRQEYRNKKVDVHIDIRDVKWLKPADIDDAFLGRYQVESEEELRDRIREMLQERAETQTRSDMSDQIYKYLLAKTDFDLPLDVVAQQASTVLQRQSMRLLTQGLARDQIEQQMDVLRASSEDQAKEQLKAFFVIDKVCDKLNIEVSEEEVNGHIAQLAVQRGQRPERMKEQMERDGSLSQFKLEIRQGKCVSELLKSAKITEKKAKKVKETTKKKAAAKKETPKKASKTSKKKSKDKAD
jgi:trigger factor